jgi:hypothetical protein
MTPYGVYFWKWKYTLPLTIVDENDQQTYYPTADEAAQQMGYNDSTEAESNGYIQYQSYFAGPDGTQYTYYRYELDPNLSDHTLNDEDPHNPGHNYNGDDMTYTEDPYNMGYNLYGNYMYDEDPNNPGYNYYGLQITVYHEPTEEDPNNPGYNYNGEDMWLTEDQNNLGFNLYGYDMNHTENPNNPGYNCYFIDMTEEDPTNPGYDYYGNPIE